MDTSQTPAPRRTSAGKLMLIAVTAILLGALMIKHDLSTDSGPPPQPVPAAAQPSAPPTAASSASPSSDGVPAMRRSQPVRIKIPKIEVDAPFIGLRLNASGVLAAPPPANRNLAGWYADGVTPGARGNAIVLGHVDTMMGPAVFWALGSLQPGDTIEIDRADGSVARFGVDSVEVFPKDAFPDERVYGKTTDAQLRLITCGGVYDKKAKDYRDNVVVFAHLLPPT
ncbi:class F sortase [Embleya scabrispora]|uniref:class F sortase n=1 Tax=Embleya scabrispora TaxID=159449 RepID=UPI0003774ECF|nr:class F sortase [Embleya scabrispora]MYS80874.1 class F sortase [Streptomyces sp. SID5474]